VKWSCYKRESVLKGKGVERHKSQGIANKIQTPRSVGLHGPWKNRMSQEPETNRARKTVVRDIQLSVEILPSGNFRKNRKEGSRYQKRGEIPQKKAPLGRGRETLQN